MYSQRFPTTSGGTIVSRREFGNGLRIVFVNGTYFIFDGFEKAVVIESGNPLVGRSTS